MSRESSCERKSVDFPEPEGPMMQTTSPGRMVRLTEPKNFIMPKSFGDVIELDHAF